ncbi:hypothetical protein E1A91_D06G213100v1 [Gossypium mustelinum]|uniref:Phorbol-ester/DAG-type domain-containing protein n=1 Tax=Gossypium mustelinum TaxID=34275 RepID=A0A5D2UNM5_GOSMU|nr:hypothetical protein E1A91_D06G213100v1 [Gossypium mustelinum]
MKNENENVSHDESVLQIQHPFHEEHPLVLVAEQSNEGLKAHCHGCGELLSAPCFTCIHCNYHLHKQCAEAPLEIPNHPLHPECSPVGLFLRQRPDPSGYCVYGCALCKEKRNMFFYECYRCYFSIDIKCAQLSSSFKFSQLSKHDIHQHPLTFIESPMAIDVLKRLNCCWCHEPLTDAIYLCPDCPSFIIHKKCLDELPTKIDHLTHRLDPLILNRSDSDYLCNLCQKQHSGPYYGCSLCHFNINVECAWPRSTVEDKSRHQHPFSLLWRQGSFICDACGTEGNCISYICSTCSLMVHKKCTSLPRIIKFSRHDHCIFHKHFLQTQELTKQDCKICFNEVKLDRGSYSCRKPGCNYVVHVNCVLEDEKLYEVIEEEKQCEELYEKSMQSSIIHVIEVNEAGEATKIQHLSHQHCLVLTYKMEEEIDRKCDGCMLPISNIFYYCSECPFFLHKTCAELPRIKQHWFRQSNATLNFNSFKQCDFCNRRCSGFFYRIGGYRDMCLREKCNGCGKTNWNGAFRCGKCRFTLDFGCLTLPHSALHKIDEHKLKLTYHDDKEQSYCDICEQYRDPSLWKVEGYPECSYCGKLCQEEILKCEESTCNYIVHYKCHWRH